MPSIEDQGNTAPPLPDGRKYDWTGIIQVLRERPGRIILFKELKGVPHSASQLAHTHLARAFGIGQYTVTMRNTTPRSENSPRRAEIWLGYTPTRED